MLKPTLISLAFCSALLPIVSQAADYNSWSDNNYKRSSRSTYSEQRNGLFTPASYQRATRTQSCSMQETLRDTNSCMVRTHALKEGITAQLSYLNRLRSNPRKVVGANDARSTVGDLKYTAQRLMDWHTGRTGKSFSELFDLQPLSASNRHASSKYTGYFTPALSVRRYPNAEYRIPIYSKPRTGKMPTHAEIARGALAGKGLEVAWTNDPVKLFFAQVQGSASVSFPDGSTGLIDYAGDNGYPFRKISAYMKKKGYLKRGLSNENIARWLHKNPHKMNEVLSHNPRFIFFNLSKNRPKTASGANVIPGHTVAVDPAHIPLGSVLLAEVPKFNRAGKEIGSEWRLLFAQDKGSAIKGAGRFDLYTGFGKSAEESAYKLTGYRKTYLLRPKG